MNAPSTLPKSAANATGIKLISPVVIKIPAGTKTTSLGKGINELSIVINIKIPMYPHEPTVEVKNATIAVNNSPIICGMVPL